MYIVKNDLTDEVVATFDNIDLANKFVENDLNNRGKNIDFENDIYGYELYIDEI